MRRAFHKPAAMAAVMLTVILAVILTMTASGCSSDTADLTGISENTPQSEAANSTSLSENYFGSASEIFSETAAEASPENPDNPNISADPILRKGDYLTCNFYDPAAFRRFDETAAAYELTGTLRAGVVTHHLLAGQMIASFFKAAAQSRPDTLTVIILAPAHYPNNTPYDLVTSKTNWATDFGEVPCDTDITEKFLTELSAGIDDEMLSYDHSASTFIPFVKYYLPDAKVSCLLISGRADKKVPEKAASLLYDISREKNCLFLFSADFSHYSSPDTAYRKDGETLAAITARDIASIELMNDDHTDAPRCLCTFIHLMNLMEADITALDRSDSACQADLPYNHGTFPEGVTSYFIFAGET